MKLFLRFEGYPRIGLGAIYKKEQIRQHLEGEWGFETVALVSEQTAPHLDGIYGGAAMALRSALYSAGEVAEIEALVRGAEARCISGLINTSEEYMAGLQRCLPVLAIEDQPTPDLATWGVLNHSPVQVWHHNYGRVGKRYLGPGYSLLRPAVLDARRLDRKAGVVVTMGGANYTGSTVRIARALTGMDCPVRVIMGPSFDHEAQLRKAIAGSRIEVSRNPPDFVDMLAGARLAVSQGGSTLYELAHLGTPPIVLGEDPHEITLGEAMDELGFGRCLGDGMKCSEDRIANEVTALIDDSAQINRMVEAGLALEVGRGWERFHGAVGELVG